MLKFRDGCEKWVDAASFILYFYLSIEKIGQHKLVFCLSMDSFTQFLKTPWKQGSWGQHGAHLGPTGPRWAQCWPHELCYLGMYDSIWHRWQRMIQFAFRSFLNITVTLHVRHRLRIKTPKTLLFVQQLTKARGGESNRFTNTSTSTSTYNMSESEYLVITWVRVRVRVPDYYTSPSASPSTWLLHECACECEYLVIAWVRVQVRLADYYMSASASTWLLHECECKPSTWLSHESEC